MVEAISQRQRIFRVRLDLPPHFISRLAATFSILGRQALISNKLKAHHRISRTTQDIGNAFPHLCSENALPLAYGILVSDSRSLLAQHSREHSLHHCLALNV